MSKLDRYYDLIASFTKNEIVLKQELDLITSTFNKGSHILDIACGSGRHLIPLAMLGYNIDGIDISKGHIEILLDKARRNNIPKNKIRITNADYLKFKTDIKYDGIICFWNSINEICLDEISLNKFFDISRSLLKYKGKMIINIDDITDPSILDFNFSNKIIDYSFKVTEYDPNTRITNSLETIKDDNKEYEDKLVQRWWDINDLIKVASRYEFKASIKNIASNNESYIIFGL